MRQATTVRVGFAQTEPEFGAVEANLDRAERLVGDAPDFDVLVLPELFATGYVFESRAECRGLAEDLDGPTVSRLRDWSARRAGWVCAGFVERAGERTFNSAALVGPSGETHVYRKIHLFDREPKVFDPGDRPFEVVEIEGRSGRFRVGTMICFDWVFPEAARCLTLAGAEVVLHPSDLVLPHCQEAMRTRCLENKVWAVTANRVGEERRAGTRLRFTGASQITGPKSEVVVRAAASGQRVAVAEVDLTPTRVKRFTAGNTLSDSRRPEMYSGLV